MSKRAAQIEFALVTSVLLIAAGLRLAGLAQAPPGIEHDEVAEVLIAQDIWQGKHALFFQQAYGQEPLFLYLAAGALALFGWNTLALRFVTAAVGLLTVAAATRLARRLFGPMAALVTAAGMSVMLWPVFWSRVGLRGMTLPLLMCLGAERLWRALQSTHKSSSVSQWQSALLSGLFFGLSAYTYLAARGLPIFFGLFVVYLFIFERTLLQRRWRELTMTLALAALIALPLIFYLLANPQLQYRVGEVNAPLTQLLQGDPGAVLTNAPRALGMFSLQGDSTARNNLPNRPVFPEPLWAALFYIGLLVALARLRRAPYGFALIWLGVMLTPTLATTQAPNFVRALGALPAVMLLPGIGAEWILNFKFEISNLKFHSLLSTLLLSIFCLALALNTWLTIRDYFIHWPQMAETQFVWQTDLAAIARALDADPPTVDITIAGLSNDSMDAPSLALLMRRKDVRARWVDSGSPLSAGGALVVPQAGGRLMVPAIVPLAPALEEQLAAWGAQRTRHARFTEFRLPPLPAESAPPTPFQANVSLVKAEMLGHSQPMPAFAAGQVITLSTLWQAGAPPYPPLKIFVHLVDKTGAVQAQHDGLDSPSRYWQPGDLIFQVHHIPLPADLPLGSYALQVGLYNRETLAPYHQINSQNNLTLWSIQVYNRNPNQ